jgi:hypothetical protein
VRIHYSLFRDIVQSEIDLVASGKDMGGSSISALVFKSYAAAPRLDRFPLVADVAVHRDRQQTSQFCYILGLLHLFMHKKSKSEAQLAGCSLKRFNSWNSTTTSSSCYRKNCDPQIRSTKEDSPQHIPGGLQII